MRSFKIPLTKAAFIGDKPGVILEIKHTGWGSTLYLDIYRVSYRSIKDILLSRRVENKLLELGIETLVDLLGFSSPYRWANQKLETRKALLSVSGLGKKSLTEIEKALALEKLTLDLTPDVDKYPILLAKERLGTIYFDFSLGLAEVSKWLDSDKIEQVPGSNGIPKQPERVYRRNGWISYADWLGSAAKRVLNK